MPLEAETEKKLGAQIDSTLSMSMVKIFSQLYIIPIMTADISTFHCSLSAMLCTVTEIDTSTLH